MLTARALPMVKSCGNWPHSILIAQALPMVQSFGNRPHSILTARALPMAQSRFKLPNIASKPQQMPMFHAPRAAYEPAPGIHCGRGASGRISSASRSQPCSMGWIFAMLHRARLTARPPQIKSRRRIVDTAAAGIIHMSGAVQPYSPAAFISSRLPRKSSLSTMPFSRASRLSIT